MPRGMPTVGSQTYNIDYFSGAQVALYIGDIWVDDVSSVSFRVEQSKRPLYGYADQYYKAVSKGQVLVTGWFTINFKEAGYLWLVLNRYRELMRGEASVMDLHGKKIPSFGQPVGANLSPFQENQINRQNIESLVNGELSTFERNELLRKISRGIEVPEAQRRRIEESNAAALHGFASRQRSEASKARRTDEKLGTAENIFEAFEDMVWGRNDPNFDPETLDNMARRCDDHRLNPFDIYIAYGDFLGTDYDNHTIRRLVDVNILNTGQEVVIDGQPIQERYEFFARNLV